MWHQFNSFSINPFPRILLDGKEVRIFMGFQFTVKGGSRDESWKLGAAHLAQQSEFQVGFENLYFGTSINIYLTQVRSINRELYGGGFLISKLHSWRREEALAYQLISTTWLASYTGIGKLGKDSFTASLVSNHGSNLVQHGHNIENRRDKNGARLLFVNKLTLLQL